MCLLMFNDKQRFWKIFSGEEMPTWVSCGGQSRGCELGSYCFLFPRIGSRQCTHEQTLAPFLLQKVTGARSGATRLEMSIKNVRVFSVAAGCQLQSCCDFGRVPRLRCDSVCSLCWQWPVHKCHCQHSNQPVTRDCAAKPRAGANLWLGGGKNPLGVTEQRWKQNTLPGERLRDDLHLRRLFGNIPFCGALAARGAVNQFFLNTEIFQTHWISFLLTSK